MCTTYPTLKFTPYECLLLVKNTNSTNWKQQILPSVIRIQEYCSQFNMPPIEALDANIPFAKDTTEIINLLAAYRFTMETKLKKYKTLKKEADQIQKQQLALTGFSTKSSNELHLFYASKLKSINKKKENLLKDVDVKTYIDNYELTANALDIFVNAEEVSPVKQ